MTAVEPIEAIPRVLREFAEHPGRYLTWDDSGKITRHLDQRRCIVVAPTFGVVTSIDVAAGCPACSTRCAS